MTGPAAALPMVPGMLTLLMLSGCGAPPATPTGGAPKGSVSMPQVVGGSPAARSSGGFSANLLPLPSARQVVGAMPVGRIDPFAAVLPEPPALVPSPPAGVASAPPPATSNGIDSGPSEMAASPVPAGPSSASSLTDSSPRQAAPGGTPFGFQLTGVIRSGGQSEAVVDYGGQSGNVRPGDLGGRTTDLLPIGWRVASIDVDSGTITLSRGGKRITREL